MLNKRTNGCGLSKGGMRRGEVLGLMWKDIDFGDVCELHVRRTYTPALKLKEPKTKSGFQTIAIDNTTAQHLRAWKTLQAECLDTLGEALAQTEDTPVCCSNIGGLYDPTNFYGWWNSFRKQAGALICTASAPTPQNPPDTK